MAMQPTGTTAIPIGWNGVPLNIGSTSAAGAASSGQNSWLMGINGQSPTANPSATPSTSQTFYGPMITTGADGTKYTDTSKQTVYAPVNTSTPTEATSAPAAGSVTKNWTLEGDPLYQSAIASGQSAFNTARNKANFELQNSTIAQQAALQAQNQQAALDRRNLAGNFAARGMQGGVHGAYAMAQDRANAALVTAQTSSKDQLAALNQQFIANYGATGTDWTATAEGQNYRNQAVQQALTALMNKYTTVA